MVDERELVSEEESGGLGDFLQAIKRRKVAVWLTAMSVLVGGVAIVFLWPTVYTSTATILLEEPEVPEDLIRTTVTKLASEQIQYINQRVMTRTNLADIIEKFDLYPEKRKYAPTLLLTNEVEANIVLDLINVELTGPNGMPMIGTIAFTLGFIDKDAKVAQQVANELVSLYMEENVRARTVQTVETRQFLSDETTQLDAQVRGIEDQIARIKETNKESLPQMLGVNVQLIQRTDDLLMDIDRELGRIATDMILVDAQLTMIDPMAAAVLPDGTVLPSPRAQLRAAQNQLAMLEGQYQAGHPDLARARREVERLSENAGTSEDLTDSAALIANARAELEAARTQYSPEHPEILRLERLVKSLEDLGRTSSTSDNSGIAKAEPDNPAWVEISARRRGLLADQAALEKERRELRRRLQEYESRMLIMPQVEQELSALERSLSSATQRFFAMRARQFGAEMGEALETQSKGERFVLVEPPNLPLEPSSPNRPVLIILLLILAPAIGLAMVPLKESIDQSIWGSKMLDSIQGGPPIAEIPVIATRADAVKATRVRIAAMVGAPITILIAALVVHFALRPLDVLWYVVLRKLGI